MLGDLDLATISACAAQRKSCACNLMSSMLAERSKNMNQVVFRSFNNAHPTGEVSAWQRVRADLQALASGVVEGMIVAGEGRPTWKCAIGGQRR